MNVYIVSDNVDFGVATSNQVSKGGSSTIISELRTDEIRDLLTDLKANANSYDLTIMICTNAKDVAISANKLSGVRAVVCKDQEDALDSVSETRANVVIIDSAKLTRRTLNEIVEGLLTGGRRTTKTQQKAPAKEEEQTTPAGPSLMDRFGSLKDMTKDAAKKIATRSEAKPMKKSGGLVSEVKKKGAKKALWGALGLEEEGK